jgi:hypothetical protein
VRSGVAGSRVGQLADSWIAVSRPPYLYALCLWWVGGTWCAGGFFPSNRSLWIGSSASPDEGTLPPWLKLSATLPHVDATPNWTERTVYNNRRLRGGWRLAPGVSPETWERPGPAHDATLQVAELGYDARADGGPHQVRYSVKTDRSSEPMALEGVTWADWDQHGRLMVVQDGCLLHWERPNRVSRVAEFNSDQPRPEPAPAWARRWQKVR